MELSKLIDGKGCEFWNTSPDAPLFDLGAMGMSAVSLPAGSSTVTADTTELMAALDTGAVKFSVPVTMNGMQISVCLTMLGFTDGTAFYQCVSLAFTDLFFLAMIVVTDGAIQVTVMPAAAAIGIPTVTASDNNKIMQVVNGAWSAVPVAESAVKTYVDEYIGSALEGEY